MDLVSKNIQTRIVLYNQMRYIIDKASKTPAYLQLYEQVRRDIVRGAHPYGSKLPSKRSTASETGVSTITVEHAYDLLREEGYVESRERSGYLVVYRDADGFAQAAARPHSGGVPSKEGVYQAGSPTPSSTDGVPLFPYPTLAKTARRVLATCGEEMLARSPGKGRPELRQTLARYLASNQGIYADPEQIIIGSGADHLYALIVGLLGRNRAFALESPSYHKIEQVYTALGVRCELLPLAPDGIESSALAATSASVLHISPYRSFPTGITAPIAKRLEYLRWAEGDSGDPATADSPGRIIVEDDFESEFSVSGRPVETVYALSTSENVIYLNTFSKTIAPALRMGYMVLPKRLLPAYESRLGFISCSVPTFDQLVVAELIESGEFSRHINRVRRARRKELFARRRG